MKADWQVTPIKNIAKTIRRSISIHPEESYRTMGVRLWGNGAYERETKIGREIKSKNPPKISEGFLFGSCSYFKMENIRFSLF